MYIGFHPFQEMVTVHNQIYNESELKKQRKMVLLVFLMPNLSQMTDDVYYIIGDDAFALQTTMMKPYSHRTMDGEERIFCYRLSRARRVVENAFGILVNRFRILCSTIGHSVSTVRLIYSYSGNMLTSTQLDDNLLAGASEPATR